MILAGLSAPERLLWQAFPRGDWVDLREGDPVADDPGRGTSWGPGRVVRAEVIRALLLGAGDAEPGHAPGLRLRGARITGRLDVTGAAIACPLVAEHCDFAEDLRFVEASTRTVRVVSSRLPAFNGTRMRLDGILDLAASRIAGALRLDQARLDGQLCLRSADIGAGGGTEAISASGLSVDGGAECDGLAAHGSVELGNATITGSCGLADARIQCPGQRALTMDRASIGRLGCRGLLVEGELRMHNAQIGATMIFAAAKLDNPGAVALSAGGLSVAGGLFLTWGFEAAGEVRLYGATLAANLTIAGATLRNPGGIALNLSRAAIGAFAGADLACEGQISLVGSRIASDIDLRNSRLTGPGACPALVADRASVAADLLCDGMTCDGGIRVAGATIGGELSFRGARVRNPGGIAVDASALDAGELSLRLAEPADGLVELRHAQVRILRDDPSSWPAMLSIDGLAYEALEPRLPALQRLEWLRRDPAGPQPRPYEQLAAHYTAIGQPGEARRVMYASERIQHRAKTPLARPWSLLQDITIGYGYQPWRAAAWIAILLAAGSIVFAIAPPPPLGSGAAPHFNPVIYALDLLLPVVDLGQKHAFNPAGAEQWLSYLLIAAGWVLVTTVAAGAARVLSRR